MKYKVIKVDMNSKYYPERLRYIDSPPKELYCLGNTELLNYDKNIAIIGLIDMNMSFIHSNNLCIY